MYNAGTREAGDRHGVLCLLFGGSPEERVFLLSDMWDPSNVGEAKEMLLNDNLPSDSG